LPYACRYVVIKKLGWGHFSTVWMVKDRKAASSGDATQFFALKVQKSAEHYTEAAMDEVELLDCISTERKKVEQTLLMGGKDSDGVPITDVVDYSNYVATLQDSFFHTGPNGKHMCMVFIMLGCNLLSVIKAYNYRGIPLPVVKNMIKGMCKGLDFLHRKCKIIHTDLKPENVLILFDESADPSLKNKMAALAIEDKNTKRNPVGVSIVEMASQLEDPNLPPDDRKKLRRRLKKKRQKERKRTFGFGDDAGSSDEGLSDTEGDGDDDDDDDDDGGEDQSNASSLLSDWEMSKILDKASNMISPTEPDSGIVPAAANRVKRRLTHSAFVTSNFGHRIVSADFKLMEVLRDTVEVKRASPEELDSNLRAAQDSGGVAEVAFMLRAFTPEDELADGLSGALSGIPWEMKNGDNSTREW
jgi:serine/threonine protein kinase